MPDGKWLPTGTGISDWFAKRGMWGLAGRDAPIEPTAPPAPPLPISEITPEIYKRLLEQYLDDEVALGRMEETERKHWLDTAGDMYNRGVWGTAEQFGMPFFSKIQKPYTTWAETQMPEAPEAIVANVEPFSTGGYDFIRQLDEQGNIIGTKFVGETPTEGMTEYERARIEQDRLQLQQTAAYQQSQARQAEMQAAAQLAGLGEEGWIERYIRGYAQRAIALEEQQRSVAEKIKGQRGKLAEAGGPLGQIRRPIGLTVTAQKAQEKIQGLGGRAQRLAAQRRELEPLPPTPEWLAPLAPWLTAGQPIERGQMPTPSGQQWQGITPSVMGGLRGFAKWGGAGRSLEDIYAHMQQMQPEAPWGGRGRWRTARQV